MLKNNVSQSFLTQLGKRRKEYPILLKEDSEYDGVALIENLINKSSKAKSLRRVSFLKVDLLTN